MATYKYVEKQDYPIQPIHMKMTQQQVKAILGEVNRLELFDTLERGLKVEFKYPNGHRVTLSKLEDDGN